MLSGSTTLIFGINASLVSADPANDGGPPGEPNNFFARPGDELGCGPPLVEPLGVHLGVESSLDEYAPLFAASRIGFIGAAGMAARPSENGPVMNVPTGVHKGTNPAAPVAGPSPFDGFAFSAA